MEEEEEEEEEEDTHTGAFNGRIAKPGDSCYSFWCGAALRILLAAEADAEGGGSNSDSDSDSSLALGGAAAAAAGCGGAALIDARLNAAHLLSLQTPIGGIPKVEGSPPDAMHSYLALAALAMHGSERGELRRSERQGQSEPQRSELQRSEHSEIQRGGQGNSEGEEKGEEGEGEEDDDDWRERSGISLLGRARARAREGGSAPSASASASADVDPDAGLDPRLNVSLETGRWIARWVPARQGGGGS